MSFNKREAVSDEAAITVGAILRVADGKSTAEPATEVKANDAPEYKATKVRARVKLWAKESAARNMSDGPILCFSGRAVVRAATAARMFYAVHIRLIFRRLE